MSLTLRPVHVQRFSAVFLFQIQIIQTIDNEWVHTCPTALDCSLRPFWEIGLRVLRARLTYLILYLSRTHAR